VCGRRVQPEDCSSLKRCVDMKSGLDFSSHLSTGIPAAFSSACKGSKK
jgi:hypothetical protein